MLPAGFVVPEMGRDSQEKYPMAPRQLEE